VKFTLIIIIHSHACLRTGPDPGRPALSDRGDSAFGAPSFTLNFFNDKKAENFSLFQPLDHPHYGNKASCF